MAEPISVDLTSSAWHAEIHLERRNNLNQPTVISSDLQNDIDRAFQAIARDPRYTHFVHIPERVMRCLDYHRVAFNRVEVRKRLHSYYLFIGVVDNAIDSGQVDTGREILEYFSRRTTLDDETATSDAKLVTEVLKRNCSSDLYSLVLAKLHELYRAVVKEREAEMMTVYIQQRKAVGRLTAELSYLLIRPFLNEARSDFCAFMMRVGTVGCLVDSAIDLRTDAELGLLSFTPNLGDFLKLLTVTLVEGLAVVVKHPRLIRLFWDAFSDNLQDQSRTRGHRPALAIVPDRKETAVGV